MKTADICRANKDTYGEVQDFYHSLIDNLNPERPYVGWKKDIYPSPEFLRTSIDNGCLYVCRDKERIAGARKLVFFTSALCLHRQSVRASSGFTYRFSSVFIVSVILRHELRRLVAKSFSQRGIVQFEAGSNVTGMYTLFHTALLEKTTCAGDKC